MIRTLVYSMLEAHLKSCQVSTVIRHNENPDIVKIVCLSSFRHIRRYSATLSYVKHVEGDQGIQRHIEALLRHTEPYSDIFRILWSPCIYNCAIFRTLTYLKPKASSKACPTCKMFRHTQSPGIIRTVYSRIIKDLLGYSVILIYLQPHSALIFL